jgi:hypothetical protein
MTETCQSAPATSERDSDWRCAVCNHDLADHDPISHRYCQATHSGALRRGCICPKRA